MFRREFVIPVAISLSLAILVGYWVGTETNIDKMTQIESEVTMLENTIDELTSPEYTIGIIYPMSGRLDWWGTQAQPIIDAAERGLQAMLAETGSPVKFSLILSDSKSTGEGALEAAKSLVAQGAQIIVGPPTTREVEAILPYVENTQIPVISPASTARARA